MLHYKKIFGSFLVRIVAGAALITGSVILVEWFVPWATDNTLWPEVVKRLLISLIDSSLALTAYILFYRYAENRKITELRKETFPKMALAGFIIGILIQTAIILIMYMAGSYRIEKINPASDLLPSFSTSLTAGFVAELLIRGVLFRILEEKLGTILTLLLMVISFAILHLGIPGGSLVSVAATSLHAGLLLSAAYVVSRSLWLPVFLHFAYDFAEPGIFGGINPGIHENRSLFTPLISGNHLITGGEAGPQNSLQALVICLILSAIFLFRAKRKNQFLRPSWEFGAGRRNISQTLNQNG
jgi:membrane protease YdiL (CAAX protease family)